MSYVDEVLACLLYTSYLTCTSEVCYIFNVVNKVDGPLMEIYH